MVNRDGKTLGKPPFFTNFLTTLVSIFLTTFLTIFLTFFLTFFLTIFLTLYTNPLTLLTQPLANFCCLKSRRMMSRMKASLAL